MESVAAVALATSLPLTTVTIVVLALGVVFAGGWAYYFLR